MAQWYQPRPANAQPVVMAHRGGALLASENSLAAIQRTMALRASRVGGAEVDVRLTRDRRVVVFHDRTLDRLTGIRGVLRRLPFREIQRVRVRGEPIPTLDQLLYHMFGLGRWRDGPSPELARGARGRWREGPSPELARGARGRSGRWRLAIELKDRDMAEEVVKVLRRAPRALPQVLIMSFHRSATSGVSALLPGTKVGHLVALDRTPSATERSRLVHDALVLGASVLCLNATSCSREVVLDAHRVGLAVWCWTVNDHALARRLVAARVDGLLTDDPVRLSRFLSSLGMQYRMMRPSYGTATH